MKYRSEDILTPANAITLAGLILTIIGCFQLDTASGLALVFIGRLLDLVDGPVARLTKRTMFSIFWDPTADKIALASILFSVVHFKLVPLWIVAYVLSQNAIVVFLSLRAERRGKAVGALIPGKLNLFFQTSAIVLFIASHVMDDALTTLLKVLAYISFAVSVPLAILAIKAYADLLDTPAD